MSENYTRGDKLTEEELKAFKKIEDGLVKQCTDRGAEEIEMEGIKLTILDTVFHPGVFDCGTKEFNQFIPLEKGKRFFDMGTGCGIFAIQAAKKGMYVVACDINPEAVKCTKINAEKNGVKDLVKVFQSDLFGAVDEKEKFDVIFWHHPYGRTDGKEEFSVEMKNNLLDEGYNLLLGFFKEGQKRLTEGGAIYVPNGAQIGDRDLFLRRVKEAKLDFEIVGSVDDGEMMEGKKFTTEIFKLVPSTVE